jgi:hypothetical protein
MGLGNNVNTGEIPVNAKTSVMFFDLYLRLKLSQVLAGDHYSKNYWLDVVAMWTSTFRFPLYDPVTDPIYDANNIVGEGYSNRQELNIFLEYDHTDDARYEFWQVAGFHTTAEFYLEFGSEYATNMWFYLGTYIEAEWWIPIVSRYLFIHLTSIIDVITGSLSGTDIPFYAYSKVSEGSWHPVRGIDTAYRGLGAFTNSFELKTRFLEFNDFGPAQNIISYLGIGFGIWADMGFVLHPNDYSTTLTYNLSEILRTSIGWFAEFKFELLFKLFRLTLHVGMRMFSNNGTEGFKWDPRFYFAFG